VLPHLFSSPTANQSLTSLPSSFVKFYALYNNLIVIGGRIINGNSIELDLPPFNSGDVEMCPVDSRA
jgi:hypothetical protein